MASPLLPVLRDLVRRDCPPQVQARAAWHVVDWLGCAHAGAVSDAGRAFARNAAECAGSGPVRVPGMVGGLTVRDATFLTGAYGNPLEMDDLDKRAILHPGPVIVPAALAAAQLVGASGPQLLAAIARGYEATIRLGRSVGPGHYARWHNTATCGPIGAAVAAAALLELGPEQTLWAMGNALTQASGPWACRHENVMTKQLHAGRAAEAGLSAALLARSGVTGPARILDGAQGFYEAMCPDPDPSALTESPEAWRILEVSFKPWPACRHCHPAIDAALALRDRVPEAAAVRAIRIGVYGDAQAFCDRPAPSTDVEAKFSLQHAVATALLRGAPRIADFEAEARADPAIVALRARAAVTRDAQVDGAYPAHYGARLDIAFNDGTTLSAHQPDALGDPELPLSPEAIAAKARGLMEWAGMSPAAAERLTGAAAALPTSPDLVRLIAAYPTALPDQRANEDRGAA